MRNSENVLNILSEHSNVFGYKFERLYLILFDPMIPYSHMAELFYKYGLRDTYYMNDDGVSLQWKAGLLLESKGSLPKGSTEMNLFRAGVSFDRIEEGIRLLRIDKLRVSDIRILDLGSVNGKIIHCRVDCVRQPGIKLDTCDVNRLVYLMDYSRLAVKYHRDVLNSNREKRLMIADERTLARLDMPEVDSWVDIYRNGVNEQELTLIKATVTQEIDPF